MANPSTDGPTSALGTEVLKRKYHTDLEDTESAFLIDGTAGYIYTVLSIIVSNSVSTPESFYILMFGDGTDDADHRMDLIPMQELASREVFVFNDRFTIAGTDEIKIYGNTAGCSFDTWITYIEQRWV